MLWSGVRGRGVLPAEASEATLPLAGGRLGSPEATALCKDPAQRWSGPVTWHACSSACCVSAGWT